MIFVFPPAGPCSPQLRLRPQVVILVIILAFVIVMAILGYAPAAAVSVAAAALAAAGDPRTAWAAWKAELGSHDQGLNRGPEEPDYLGQSDRRTYPQAARTVIGLEHPVKAGYHPVSDARMHLPTRPGHLTRAAL